MKNRIVSIRVPNTMINELKEIAIRDHFLDISEVIRTIIRDNWLKFQNTSSSIKLNQLNHEILENESKDQKMILQNIKKLNQSIIGDKNV